MYKNKDKISFERTILLTPYGKDVYLTIFIVSILAVGFSYFFLQSSLIKSVIYILAFAIVIFTINFFRDPERITPKDDSSIISPADGKIIQIRNIKEDIFIKDESILISIFMSPLNVHVNRIPIDGKVAYINYVKGEYFAAFEDKASLKNEQSHIGIESKFGKVFFKQIAGFVARRIIYDIKVEDEVKKGNRFGMIKFGSRVDIYLPKNVNINVKIGEVTVAGETILANFK
ncbi:MAG: phosphatidylserine decarboxylase family protein [Bacteroidota bacterium]